MLTVTVTDRDRNYVMGLTRDVFTITDEKVARPISSFKDSEEPMSIGILIDTSGSMQQPETREAARGETISAALQRFLELGNANNEYFVASFDVGFRMLSDWQNARGLIANKPVIAQPKKETALYDACFAALDKLGSARYQKRALILFSDGVDSVSKRKYSALVRKLKESDVMFYAIGPLQVFGGPFLPFRVVLKEGEAVLRRLAEINGGVALITENQTQFMRAIEQIAVELRHQYRLGFQSASGVSQNEWRHLKVRVAPPANAPSNFSKLIIRTRQGFYAQ